jgi:hypothetical protein
MVLLAERDKRLCQQDPNRKRCHFYKSFFFTKALNEGHMDASKKGKYEYPNVKHWSQKVPGTYHNCFHPILRCFHLTLTSSVSSSTIHPLGKSLFNLDKILVPVNIGFHHWTLACIFMEKKCIQYYDSLNSGGDRYVHPFFHSYPYFSFHPFRFRFNSTFLQDTHTSYCNTSKMNFGERTGLAYLTYMNGR